MKCPVCNAPYRPSGEPVYSCRRCGVDLSPLLQLYDRALRHHREAIEAFQSGDYETAIARNRQARELCANDAEFQAFAGQLLATRGEFAAAARAWRKALRLNPRQSLALTGLQCLRELSRRGESDVIEFF